MSGATGHLSYLERMWERGQEHLAAGRYAMAVRELEAAESAAWRRGNAVDLARVHLPLLEARRQIRYQAAEGVVLICDPTMPRNDERELLRDFLRGRKTPAGTILLGCIGGVDPARRLAGSVQYEARRSGRSIEALLLAGGGGQRGEVRLTTAADGTFAGGLPVTWTHDPHVAIGPSTDSDLTVPLPPAGRYTPTDALHALARETLIVGWEALALKWQHRHPPPHNGGPWEEMAWLRLALRIDPACEPVAMRLMALAEAAGRAG